MILFQQHDIVSDDRSSAPVFDGRIANPPFVRLMLHPVTN